MSLPIPGTGKRKKPNVERLLWHGKSHRRSSFGPQGAKRIRDLRYAMITE